MKIKKDFVTNSSSSSFIVGFKEIPKSANEMKNLLFGDLDLIEYDSFRDGKCIFNTLDLATDVFNNLSNKRSYSDIMQTLGFYDLDDEIYEKLEETLNYFYFTYGDDDAFEAALQYSNIFEKLPHVMLSNH